MNMHPSSLDRRGGALVKLLVFLLILSGILVVAWIYYLPALLTSTLEKRTGFTVSVTKMRVNPFTARVEMEGLVLSNPPTFPRNEFIRVRSFYANAEFRTLLSDRPVINEAILDVALVGLVRNAEGTLNARLFNDRLFPAEKIDDVAPGTKKPAPKVGPKPSSPNDAPAKPAPRPRPPEPPLNFMIKRLDVKLDRLLVEDFAGGKPGPREYALNFQQTFENVTDPKQLVNSVATRSLSSVGAAISGLIPGDLGKAIDAATKSGKELFKGSTTKGADALKGFVDTLEESKKP